MNNIKVSYDNKGNSFLRQYAEFPSKITSRVVLVGDKRCHIKMKHDGYVPLSMGDIIVDLFRFKDDFTINFFEVTKTEKGEKKFEKIAETENMQNLVKLAKKISNKN